jgi:hypothetical protein
VSGFIRKTHKILTPDPLARKIDKNVGLGALAPDVPDAEPIPEPPTIDDARKRRDYLDRIRQRRGVLATVFGGASSTSTPKVGAAQLLGG